MTVTGGKMALFGERCPDLDNPCHPPSYGPSYDSDSYGKTDYIHDIVKNAICGACAYLLSDNSALAGLATAGVLSTLDTIYFASGKGECSRQLYHIMKDWSLGIVLFASANCISKNNVPSTLEGMILMGSPLLARGLAKHHDKDADL